MTSASDPLEQGRVLAGTYRIEGHLSRGAFGSVYKATRMDDGLPVVAKALREDAGAADPAAVQRFIREAAVAAMLDHPNIVRTLNFGKTRDNVLYIILERLRGDTLANAMFEEPVDPKVTAEVLRQMLSALEYAHGMGIVHRDLKPSNVFVSNPEHTSAYGKVEGNMVKLLDFGFVKVLDPPNPMLAKQLTKVGSVVGTPGYIAPEQLSAEGGDVTARADLYSVGVLGYELLTAQKAFAGEGLQRAMRQLDSDPAPPPKALREEPIVPVLMKLMARDPEQRYQSARLALDDVEKLPRIT